MQPTLNSNCFLVSMFMYLLFTHIAAIPHFINPITQVTKFPFKVLSVVRVRYVVW